ncbi:hypothetical protein AB0M87_04630 [Streptomyces sp. NPDC051320]|uniref:DUF7341 domain-containing protein n=1 Tax=Streptomyces sp. NPDC051320 TaxID=3154644 RepID=UPI003435A295
MPENTVNVTLTFATNSAPAVVAARVVDIVVAEVAAQLTAARWHGSTCNEAPDPAAACAHESWEETPFQLADRSWAAARRCADCALDTKERGRGLMQNLDSLVADLLERYTGDDKTPGDGGPGLIARLDTLGLRTRQPRDAGGHSTPGSRPPTSLEAVSWSQRIKTEAVQLDTELRRSSHGQAWYRALRAIPPGAEAADRVGEVTSTVSRWHGTVLTVLGLRGPSVHFRHALCLACGQRTVYGRADDDRPRAWCINDQCDDGETGQPARYEGTRMYLLTTHVTQGETA